MDERLKKIGMVLGCTGLLLRYTARFLNADKLQWPALLIALVGVVLVGLSKHIRRKKNAANPITTVCVRVLGRRTERYGRYQSKIRHFLSFRPVKGGARLEFEVPWVDFDTYHEDDIGVLRYRTWEYLSFS